MIQTALRKIEAKLRSMADLASDGHRPDEYELREVAKMIAAQAEMVERGLAE